ncbi:MAG: Xaa-Pro peptidase family protein [Nitrososphaerales archaeon]|nr:Xaa-Pro peptidase family protein [Nitrososphaerales archaeon]
MFEIPKREYEERLAKLRLFMAKQRVDCLILTNGNWFSYFTGFFYLVTERPAAMAVTANKIAFFGPVMEEAHLHTQTSLVDSVSAYPDYPGETHPAKLFAKWLKGLRTGNRVGTDGATSFPGYWGYKGPKWSDLLPNVRFVTMGDSLYPMRQVKSPNEQRLIRESIRWGDLGHRLLQKYTKAGLYDFDIAARASLEASMRAKRALGPRFKGSRWGLVPVHAGFRGQVGAHSVYPHSISIEREIRRGDVLGSGASADIAGYNSEVERNLFVGKPSAAAGRYHRQMLKMQDAALAALRPRGRCSDVDRAVLAFAKKEGATRYLLHHSGHAIGLEGHEAPFLDVGDETEVKPGMVFTVEPGIYIPGLGGFRHSDTVLVREDSTEVMTHYPRDTESLTIS